MRTKCCSLRMRFFILLIVALIIVIVFETYVHHCLETSQLLVSQSTQSVSLWNCLQPKRILTASDKELVNRSTAIVYDNTLHTRSFTTHTGASPIMLSDIYISVKTGGEFHKDRVMVQVKTWYNLAKEQVNLLD